jgi:outer membrane immunogenic protein
MTSGKGLIVTSLGITMAVAGQAVAADVSSYADEKTDYYVGVMGGIAGAHQDVQDPVDDPPYGEDPTITSLGVLAGARWHMGDYVAGGELDIAAALNGDFTDNSFQVNEEKGTAHARLLLGRELGPVTLFAAGGIAAARLRYQSGNTFENATFVGWTVGAGADVRVSDHVSVRAEFLHDDFGNHTFSDDYNGSWTENTVRAAAIFHF